MGYDLEKLDNDQLKVVYDFIDNHGIDEIRQSIIDENAANAALATKNNNKSKHCLIKLNF